MTRSRDSSGRLQVQLKKRALAGAFFLLISLTLVFCLHQESSASPPFLAQYGQVIYQFNQESSNQLFIVGIAHRDSLACLNADYTSRVQAEIYKIGEWLIEHDGVELLLPEGYFGRKEGIGKPLGSTKARLAQPLDLQALETIFADNRKPVNAEMLLKENYAVRLRQIEDPVLYEDVRKKISALSRESEDSCDYPLVIPELDKLQERRTAAMLQQTPEIVNDEAERGNIKHRKAMLTIGMSHVHWVIEYLQQGRIKTYSPLSSSRKSEKDSVEELNLVKEHFGVTIILPRTLTEDRNFLEMNRLHGLVSQRR